MTENNSTNEKTVEAPEALPMEAGVSLNWTMIDTNGANVQVTMRSAFAASWPSVMRNRAGFMQKALENGWSIGGPKPNASPPTTPAQAAIETGKANVPPPVPGVPQAAAGNSPQTVHCAMIEIGKSYSGDKTQLKFHCDGMDKTLNYTKSEGDMVKLLAPLGYTAAHIVVGQKYPADCIVTWNTTTGGDGKNYRNVLSVRPNA